MKRLAITQPTVAAEQKSIFRLEIFDLGYDSIQAEMGTIVEALKTAAQDVRGAGGQKRSAEILGYGARVLGRWEYRHD